MRRLKPFLKESQGREYNEYATAERNFTEPRTTQYSLPSSNARVGRATFSNRVTMHACVLVAVEIRAGRALQPGPRAAGLLHAERGGHRHAGRRAGPALLLRHGARPRRRRQRLPAALLRVALLGRRPGELRPGHARAQGRGHRPRPGRERQGAVRVPGGIQGE